MVLMDAKAGDLDAAANAICGWLLERVSLRANEELCDLHPDTWKEVAEVGIRAWFGESDCRPFSMCPDLPR